MIAPRAATHPDTGGIPIGSRRRASGGRPPASGPICRPERLNSIQFTLAYLDFPYKHHIKLRTDNVQERANEEIERRIEVVGVFPSIESMKRLAGSVILDINEDWMGRRFIDAGLLKGITRMRGEDPTIPVGTMEKAKMLIEAALRERRDA